MREALGVRNMIKTQAYLILLVMLIAPCVATASLLRISLPTTNRIPHRIECELRHSENDVFRWRVTITPSKFYPQPAVSAYLLLESNDIQNFSANLQAFPVSAKPGEPLSFSFSLHRDLVPSATLHLTTLRGGARQRVIYTMNISEEFRVLRKLTPNKRVEGTAAGAPDPHP